MIIQEPFSEYKAKSQYINPSSFKGEDVYTPKHFLSKRTEKQDESLSMKVGSALHCAVLTPDLLLNEYAFTQKKQFVAFNESGQVNFQNKQNKIIFKNLKEQAGSKILLKPDETELVAGMVKGVKEDIPDLNYLLNRKYSNFECSLYLFAKFDKKGHFEKFIDLRIEDVKELPQEERAMLMPVKTRSDHYHTVKGYATDLKTSKCAHPAKFMYDAEKYGYHIQAAFTLDLLNCQYNTTRYNAFIFIVVENHRPYAAIKLNANNAFIQMGREDYINRLEYIHESYNCGYFKGYEIMSQYRTFDNDNNEIRNMNMCDLDLPPTYYYRKKMMSERFPFIKSF